MEFERCVTAGLERLMPSAVCCPLRTRNGHGRAVREKESNQWPISCP